MAGAGKKVNICLGNGKNGRKNGNNGRKNGNNVTKNGRKNGREERKLLFFQQETTQNSIKGSPPQFNVITFSQKQNLNKFVSFEKEQILSGVIVPGMLGI